MCALSDLGTISCKTRKAAIASIPQDKTHLLTGKVTHCFFFLTYNLNHFSFTVPCCPQDVTVKLVSTETLEVMWSPVKGAEVYETTAVETGGIVHCNDTSPVCALSDLSCNTPYSVTVTPCSELRGCNLTCAPSTKETGIKGADTCRTIHTEHYFIL